MTEINKKSLSEEDICTKFITPAVEDAGWDVMTQIRQQVYFTDGRIFVRGKLVSRGKGKKADYILYYKSHLPIAVIEAKDNKHSVGSGMQQGLDYGEILDIPFVFSSNGDGFLFHDRTVSSGKKEIELSLEEFPSPEELWQKYCKWKNIDDSNVELILQAYHSDGTSKEPRYYQRIAINRTVEAISKGANRALLVMATGTGKTYTAFQIMWRLWKSKQKKRILFLADRNILVDQSKNNDFKPFGGAMTKIKHRKADKAFEIYLALYQGITGPEEEKKLFKSFSKDFFDLIIIDECHRGSASEDSAWREILEYFDSATQIGLTATPKETEYVSNIDYFGEPIYTYSLKQGIEDGFLAPYKVVRIDIDKDLEGWRPQKGQTDRYGEEIADRIYNQKDFDRSLVLEKRTELVAKKISEFLRATNPYDKTIVFCEDIDHAERMRQALVNENADLVAKDRKYIMQITGDNDEGKAELDNFIHPEKRYPVVVTTSRLLTTGVDAKTCKLIVLDRSIQSMTEFKQIVGRGTRVDAAYDKYYFTIMDFRKATELFADEDFDGDPVQIYQPKPDESPVPPDEDINPVDLTKEDIILQPSDVSIDTIDREKGGKRLKFYVNNVEVSVLKERVQYYGKDGKLVTESLTDYTRKTVKDRYPNLDSFLKRWNEEDKKQAIVDELVEHGVLFDALEESVGKDFEPFDLVCHVAFGQPPLTRKERAQKVKKSLYFTKYTEVCRRVIDALLEKYAADGVENLENISVLKIPPVNQYGTPVEIISNFGGKDKYIEAINELKRHLYA